MSTIDQYLICDNCGGRYGIIYEPVWIREALLASAKTTLQTLKFLAWTHTLSGSTFPDHFMGSLQEFEALREIYTEWRYLFPEQCDVEAVVSTRLCGAEE